MTLDDVILTALMFAAALLYASVGHAGASGYLAAMALFGVPPEVMRPTALTLNILVAMIATVKFYRAGAFSWPLFWPFAVTAAPLAFLGGSLALPAQFYKPVVGLVLLYAAWYSFRNARTPERSFVARPHLALLLGIGALLGLLSGLTGVGGGIFLSPLLLLCRWADARVISGIAAAFILVNSVAGLLGVMSSPAALPTALPTALPYWAIAVVLGGFIGAEYGSRRLPNPVIKKLLALVLLIAAIKMLAQPILEYT